MNYDPNKVDDMVLALLHLTSSSIGELFARGRGTTGMLWTACVKRSDKRPQDQGQISCAER